MADMFNSRHSSILDTIFWKEFQIFYWICPPYSGHLAVADTFFENQCCPLSRSFTVFLWMREYALFLSIGWNVISNNMYFKMSINILSINSRKQKLPILFGSDIGSLIVQIFSIHKARKYFEVVKWQYNIKFSNKGYTELLDYILHL